MLKKGFIRNQNSQQSKHHRLATIVSSVMLYVGAIILIGSFAYLLFGDDKSGMLIGMLVPFLITGLGFILVSQLIKRAFKKLR